MVDDFDDRFQKWRRKQVDKAKRPSWMHKPSNDRMMIALSVAVVVALWFLVWVLGRMK